MTSLNPVIAAVTARIAERSREKHAAWRERMEAAVRTEPARKDLPCSNLAHVAAGGGPDKQRLALAAAPNVGIVTAYNDMLSAHRPFEAYPEILRQAATHVGATAQVAGGVPAMCDGVTQGRDGMELSLFSRDVIALATGVALSHDAFDATLLLGVCDKIVPGLFMGAAAFAHLPTLWVPAGPMTSGVPNKAKAEVRKRFAEGKATREELLASEMGSYHDVGTCTFYGTANTNQMVMEFMGLHVPGAAFVNPLLPLRHALTVAALEHVVAESKRAPAERHVLARVVDVRSIVNAVIGLMATGGSTNHTLHLPAMARAIGVHLTWEDMADLSAVTPLLARVYPNGKADVNHFHAAGGLAFVIRELLDAGLLHADAPTAWPGGLRAQAREPFLTDGTLQWREAPAQSLDEDVLRPVARPFSAEGGLRRLQGSLGEAVIKVSAVDPNALIVEAPARVFDSQEALVAAFKAGQLNHDFIAVVRGQGPRANGMPELHSLTPPLSSLMAHGYKVALVTDGRMSGASGSVPAAIHVTPEAMDGGPIAQVRDGDLIRLDALAGKLEVLADLTARTPAKVSAAPTFGFGRELFANARATVGTAAGGASFIL
jgi:phosphogluconate dehydratase